MSSIPDNSRLWRCAISAFALNYAASATPSVQNPLEQALTTCASKKTVK
jgi:hypothetical protein